MTRRDAQVNWSLLPDNNVSDIGKQNIRLMERILLRKQPTSDRQGRTSYTISWSTIQRNALHSRTPSSILGALVKRRLSLLSVKTTYAPRDPSSLRPRNAAGMHQSPPLARRLRRRREFRVGRVLLWRRRKIPQKTSSRPCRPCPSASRPLPPVPVESRRQLL